LLMRESSVSNRTGFVTRARRRIAPQLRNSSWDYREALEERVQAGDRWLDLGCGRQLLPLWMSDGERQAARLVQRCRLVVGMDRFHAALEKHGSIRHRVNADVGSLPFQDSSFDLVTANMVLEHVEDANGLFSEVHRVLTAGGLFLFHTPNRLFYQILLALCVPPGWRRKAAQLLEGRAADDVFETRYRANTSRVVRTLAARHGFEVDELRLMNSSLATSKVAPLALLELAAVRVLETRMFAWGRSNMIVTLRKR
jgi:SAM-dependent methyltransferase